MSTLQDLIHQLTQCKGAKFAGLTYRSKETHELARYTVILGVDRTALYQKDRETLRTMLPSLEGLPKQAAEALLASIEESLAKGLGNNSAYTHGPEQGDTYLTFDGLPDVKLNVNDGVLHLMAIVQSKTVLEEGEYKHVNSKPLTLAKNAIRRELRQSKIRQFALPNLSKAKLNGETLELG